MEDLFLDGAQKSLESSRCSELSVPGLLSAAAKVQWDSKYSIKILLTIPWDLGTTTGRPVNDVFFWFIILKLEVSKLKKIFNNCY